MSHFDEQQKKRRWRQWSALAVGVCAIGGVLMMGRPGVQTQIHMASCRIGASFGQVAPAVPVGSPWADARVLRRMPPQGYAAGAAWLTAVTATECVPTDAEAKIEIDTLRVVGVQSDGTEEVVFEERFVTDDEMTIDSGLYVRYPTWFARDWHTALDVSVEKGRWMIDMQDLSQKVVHAWTPRFAVAEGVQYVVEARVRVKGIARIQFGLDFWRDFVVTNNGFDEFCRGTHNCEAHVGTWIGDTDGAFVTVRSVQN